MCGIIDEITAINPDILCIIEGPGNLPDLQAWVESPDGLSGRYRVATIPGTDEILQENPEKPCQALQKLYTMQGNALTGDQWIWFLVRDSLFQESGAHILDPRIWQDLTRQSDWPVHYWGKLESSTHNHWRHPQTFIMKISGVEMEFIGGHLKSKINTMQPFDESGNLMEDFMNEALRARVRLATEASDIRRYIKKSFAGFWMNILLIIRHESGIRIRPSCLTKSTSAAGVSTLKNFTQRRQGGKEIPVVL